MHLAQLYTIAPSNQFAITEGKNDPLVTDILAVCHSVEMIDGQLRGDEIDLRMF